MEHLQRVWLASRERLPLRTPGSVPLFWGGLHVLWLLRPVSRLYTDLMTVPNLTFTELRGFHGAFATGVASQQGALTLPDTWFRPPFWDLLMLGLLRPNSSNLPCLHSTFHLEYPLVLSRFYYLHVYRWCIVHKQPRIRKLSRPDVSCWTWDQGHHREHHFSRFGGMVNFTLPSNKRQTRWFKFPHYKLPVPE